MASVFRQAKTAFFNPTYGWKTTHFWGPVANWGVALAGVYDMTQKDASHISAPMTGTLALYSLAFMRFAWRVSPRNYILFACHIFNEAVQLTQLYRSWRYQQSLAPIREAFSGAVVASGLFIPRIQQRVMQSKVIPARVKELLNHPAGPFTIFFWAPMMKWGLSIANLVDYKRPVDKLSVPQQTALVITGLIWTRWSFVITPVNYNLALVNFALAGTGLYHLTRKLVYDPFPQKDNGEH